MKVLVDTAAFLWIISDPQRLSHRALEIYENENNDLFLSVVSMWEIITKYKLNKLPLAEKPGKIFQHPFVRSHLEVLSLKSDDVLELLRLPSYHKDPFDRMLVCQALNHHMKIMTPDPMIKKYPVETIW